VGEKVSDSASGTGSRWPLVSVVMPTRGRPELVRDALAGVVEQTYGGPLECIVVHDQEPPDPELAGASRPGRTVLVHHNDRRPGLPGARNAGRARARGSFIASCDDDDRWHPEKLQVQMEWLLSHPDINVVGAGIRQLLPGDRVVDWPGDSELVSMRDLVRSRFKELHSSTLLVRRETFDLVGGYDEDLPFGYAEDYEWLLRAARLGPLGVVNRPLADIRQNAGSWFLSRQAVVVDGLEYLLRTHPELRSSRRGEARIRGQIAFAHASLGHRRAAIACAGTAMRRWPLGAHAAVAILVASGLDPRVALDAARVVGRGIT
jgi:glycosyltransferase involved in cell wall biosynthesis